MAKAKEAPTTNRTRKVIEDLLAGDKDAPKVSSIVTSGRLWDYTHAELLDHAFVMHRFDPITTRYGDAFLADVDVDGEQKTVLIGGDVLKKQIVDLEPHLPLPVAISRPGRSYVFTDPTTEQLQEMLASLSEGTNDEAS